MKRFSITVARASGSARPLLTLWLATAATAITVTPLAAQTEVSDSVGRMEILPGDLERFPGMVVAAPHADYDDHTGEIVGWIHEEIGAPAIRAWGYRRPRDLVWYDVNRPFTRRVVSGELDRSRITDELAEEIYGQWQRMADEAAGVDEGPVDLYIDIHGHRARYDRPDGTRGMREVVEAVGLGFTDEQVNRIRDAYDELVVEHGLEDAAPMFFFQVDPYYEYQGAEVNFMWTASGARLRGALRPECARRALHFENPGSMRDDPERRRVVAAIYADLIEVIWEDILASAE